MDVVTREIVGCYIGDPSWQIGSGTVGLLARRGALLVPFAIVIFGYLIPWRCARKRRAVGKETSLTSYPHALQLHH